MLHKSYARLTRPPLNLESDDLLSAVIERLIKAMRETRPENVRQFFALANQHMRWELNGLARTLDQQSSFVFLGDDSVAAPASSASGPGPNAARVLAAIDSLSEEEREAFDLVRIQGLSHGEVGEILGVSTKTVQRRLHRALLRLVDLLGDIPRAEAL
jgi:RNA polymerase sigma-70 factor (ECF subfamily)